MKKYLNHLISETQSGFLKGRYIGESTRLIYDILERTNKENILGIIFNNRINFKVQMDHTFIVQNVET